MSITTVAGTHRVQLGDKIIMKGQMFTIESVTETTFTIRRATRWNVMWSHIRSTYYVTLWRFESWFYNLIGRIK